MGTIVTKAENYKKHFPFIIDWDKKRDISYHFQFIEYLYIKKRQEEKTTLSLINKTIIIEYFAIGEAIIDALLCQLYVNIGKGATTPLYISQYDKASNLFELANKYGIIDIKTRNYLKKIGSARNFIHIKRPKSGNPEYSFYTNKLLGEHEKVFKYFLDYLFDKYSLEDSKKFSWPWNIK